MDPDPDPQHWLKACIQCIFCQGPSLRARCCRSWGWVTITTSARSWTPTGSSSGRIHRTSTAGPTSYRYEMFSSCGLIWRQRLKKLQDGSREGRGIQFSPTILRVLHPVFVKILMTVLGIKILSPKFPPWVTVMLVLYWTLSIECKFLFAYLKKLISYLIIL